MKNEKIVRWIVKFFFFMSILVFVYSLGFFTNFLPIRSAYRELYDKLQMFNRQFFNYSLMSVIPIMLMLTFDSHKTNRYGIGNKISNIVASGFAIYQAVFVISQLGGFSNEYSVIDPKMVQILYPNYKVSGLAFTFGYFIYGLLAVASIGILIVAVVNNKKATE